MNKPLLKQVAKTTGCALLLIAMAFVINSCRKDNKLTGQTAASVDAAAHFAITDARAWFGSNKTSLATKIKLNSETSFLSEMANFTPLWDSARTAVDTNFYVVEAPAKYVKAFGFATDETQQNVNGITRLLVLKSKRTGDLSAALMHIHGDPLVKTANVHYMAVPQNFSGNIFYTTLQGIFINGNIFKDGIITKTSNKIVSSEKKADGPKILTVQPGECEVVTIDYYTQTCLVETNGQDYTCSPWAYSYSEVFEYCAPAGTSPPTGGVYNPVQCPPTTPGGGGGGGGGGTLPTVESLNGKKVIRLVQGGDPGGGCPVNQPAIDTAKIIKDFCDSLTSGQKATIINTLKQMQTANCASKYLYNKLVQSTSGFTFCIKAGSGSAAYDPIGKGITFTTDYAASRVDQLQHEMFHGYQDTFYPNGTAGYGKNASTGAVSPGFPNIEFEQAVFSDIINNGSTAFDKGTPQQRTAYEQWLGAITNDFLSYPKLMPGTIAYDNFINQYNSFLNQFNSLPNNPLSGPIISLNPDALINLFNQTNCN